jgi:hypothetical protein
MSKFLEKVNKSELWVTLAALAAVLIAPQLGMEEAALEKLIMGILSLAGVYTAGMSHRKSVEAKADALKGAALGKPEPSTEG